MTDRAPSSLPFARASALGAALGVAYLSPFTVWFCGVMAALFWWAGRGLPARERRWIWGVMAVSVAFRVLMIAALFIASDGRPLATFYWEPDSWLYKFRSMALVQFWQDKPPGLWGFTGALDREWGSSAYVQVLAYLQFLLGTAPYGVHLLNTAISLTAAVLLHRLVRPSFGPVAALLGLALLVFWPSWFSTSASSLRDPSFWLLAAIAVVCCVSMVRSRIWKWRAALGVLALGACVALDTIRLGGTITALSALLLGLASAAIARRATVALLTVPILVATTVFLWSSPPVGVRALSLTKQSGEKHKGVVFTGGGTYKLLDARLYDIGPDAISKVTTMTPVEARRFVVRAGVSILAFPLPWQSRSMSQVVYIPQQVMWYIVLALVPIGVVAGFRRDALLTSVLTSMTLFHLAVVGLRSGNFGTMVRHRDMAFLFIIWLGALGAASALTTLVTRRTVPRME